MLSLPAIGKMNHCTQTSPPLFVLLRIKWCQELRHLSLLLITKRVFGTVKMTLGASS